MDEEEDLASVRWRETNTAFYGEMKGPNLSFIIISINLSPTYTVQNPKDITMQ